jgi:hypothetical protein
LYLRSQADPRQLSRRALEYVHGIVNSTDIFGKQGSLQYSEPSKSEPTQKTVALESLWPRTWLTPAMLFAAEPRAKVEPGLQLLAPRNLFEVSKETLPYRPEGRDAQVTRLNRRHPRKRGVLEPHRGTE